MIKKLKVCRKWSGNKAVPSVQLQGIYLEEFNFNINDTVRVEFYRDEIRIKKMSAEQILRSMTDENPELARLIAELDCVACE